MHKLYTLTGIAAILALSLATVTQAATVFTHTYGLNTTDVDGGALNATSHTWTENFINVDGTGVDFDLVLTVVANGNLNATSGMGITGTGNVYVEPGDSATFSLAINNFDAGTSGLTVDDVEFGLKAQGLHTNAKGGTDSGTFTLINGVAPTSTLTWIDSNGGSDFTGHGGNFDLVAMNAAYGDGSDVTSFTHVGAGAAWTFNSQSIEYSVVPEPSSFALLGGLLALGAVMVRRRH